MGGKNYKIIALICYCALWFVACKKDKPVSTNTSLPVSGASENTYIVCEGALGNGNASLSLYSPATGTVYPDIYQTVNHQSLGDVFESMIRIDSRLFLCVNNSDKVVVIDDKDWKLAGIINIKQPRYILPVSSTKAYVSTLFSNTLYVIDPQTLQVTGSINMPNQNPEGMLLDGENAFVCTWDTAGNSVYEINTANDQVTKKIKVAGYAPQEILMDKEQKLWVLSGDQTEGKTCALSRVDPSTGSIIQSYQFPVNADPVRPAFNNAKDTLYIIEANQNGGTENNGIYRMSINDTALPKAPFVSAAKYQYFWALGIDPKTGYIYVGDPMGFVQQGSVYIYRQDGTLVNQFKVGLGPGHFYFD
ncbi:MAG TPA: DUF5074 domain-containing protein [Flavipsychrobacter sp.]|nr:DUF5074 domain-containing protein [Flavipsychrobacter sp.]